MIALGKLGWSETQFWDSTLRALFNAVEGWTDLEESRQRQEWERMRLLAWITIKPHVKAGTLKKPGDLIPFEWDEKAKAKARELTEEERERLKRWDNGRNRF